MPILKKKTENKKPTSAKATAGKEEAKAKKAVKEAKIEAPARATGDAWRVLIRPLVTERYSGQGTDYAFEVAPKANKLEIRKAIKAVFNVTPVSVRVMNVLGKAVRTRAGYSQRPNWRKAIIGLKKGESIDLFAKNA